MEKLKEMLTAPKIKSIFNLETNKTYETDSGKIKILRIIKNKWDKKHIPFLIIYKCNEDDPFYNMTNNGYTFQGIRGFICSCKEQIIPGIENNDICINEYTKFKHEFDTHHKKFNLKESDYNKTFTCEGEKFKLIGILKSARKYPIIGKDKNNNVYQFPIDVIK